MSTIWRCAVCESVNQGGRSCVVCGAAMTRRSAVVTSARGRLTPAPPPTRIEAAPLPEPVRRAINREPVEPEEWGLFETEPRIEMLPLPGGCLFSVGPRRRRRRRWLL